MPQKDALGALIDLAQDVRSGLVTAEDLDEFRRRPKLWQEIPNIEVDWIKRRVDWCNHYLRRFFNNTRDHLGGLSEISLKVGGDFMAKTLEKYGRKQVEEWENRFELRIIQFSPTLCFNKENSTLESWKIKPPDWFYKLCDNEKIFINDDGRIKPCDAEHIFGSIVLLVDPRAIPGYNGRGEDIGLNDGTQMWKDDRKFVGNLLRKLRKQERIRIPSKAPTSSRFWVSTKEWETAVRPELAKLWKLPLENTILEPVLMANIISQVFTDLPRATEMNDKNEKTLVCYEEFCDMCKDVSEGGGVIGKVMGDLHRHGNSECFESCGLGYRSDRLSFRPLGVLAVNK